MEKIIESLIKAGFDFGIAFATEPEIENSAACGQLAIITEQ